MAAIFISHSSLDDPQADALKRLLAEIGFTEIFLDFDKHMGIPLGSDWESRLYREMERCQAVLLVLTKNWLDSKWCFAEFAQARALGKTIFVVVETPRGETAIASDLQICDLASDREGGLDRLRHALKESLLVAQAGFAFPRDRAPYPGLVSFEAADAAVFFGRDQEVAGAFEWARSERSRARKALALVGGSGTGKSSLLKAGVLPRLQRERDSRGAPLYLVIPPVRPGDSPMREWLAALQTLDPALSRADLDAATTPEAARDLIDRLRAKAGASQAILVVSVDQAEELFSARDSGQARLFLAGLTALIAEDNPARLLLTIRADHIDDLQRAAGLSDALELFPVKPMPVERLSEIVRGPARRVDLTIEDALVEAIRADATSSDALPLVAFLLRELYDRYGKSARRLERAHYDALRLGELSPLEAAVRRKADETVKGASQEAMAALRDAFTPGLVRLDEDRNVFLRRAALRADLPPASLGLIDALAGARLLIEDSDERGARVEVAHEALFRVWPTLAGWLAEEREFLIGKSRIERLFADYRALPEAQRGGGLLTGVLMERARAWLERHPDRFRDDEAAFIRASVAEADRLAREKRRAARRLHIALATAAAVFAIFGGVALWQRNVAQEQARIAEEQRAQAETQRARAERALTAATDAAAGLVFGLAERYRNRTDVPATVIADIVGRALALQDTLLGAGEQSPKLRRSEMFALNERVRSLLTLGNTAAALAAGEKSLAIARDLAKDKTDAVAQGDLAVTLERFGDAKSTAGDRAGALVLYNEELTIVRELAKQETSPLRQRNLSATLARVGRSKGQSGDSAGALAAFEEALAILRDLGKAAKNAQSQSDLSLALDNLGDAKAQAGDRAGALAAYEESLAIAQDIAGDKGNAVAQHDLVLALAKIGGARRQAGDLPGALAAYQQWLAIARDLAADKGNAMAQRDLSSASAQLGALSGDFVNARQFDQALAAASAAATAAPGDLHLQGDRARALMLLGRVDEARALYLAFRGMRFPDGKSWEVAVREDFAALRRAGLDVPFMKEIDDLFATAR